MSSKKKTIKKKQPRLKTSYNSGEVLTMVYDVWISGKKLAYNKKACITDLSIKETDGGSDTATITISDPNFLFIEDNIFLEENTIMIKHGFSNSTFRHTFKGYISTIDINFPESGIPELSIVCMDETHRMNRKKRSKTYKNTTSADVVKKILKGYGYKCIIDNSYKFTKQDSLSQSDQSDIEFIQKLAQDETRPFTARLSGKTFYYVKKGKLSSVSDMEVTYKKSPCEIISFSPQINKESKQVEVKSSKVDGKSKTVTKSKAQKTSSKKTPNTKSGSEKSTITHTYNANKTWTTNKK